MSAEPPLLRLADSTAAAVAEVLDGFAPGAVGAIATALVPVPSSALDGFAAPAVVSSVSYVDGVTGGNVFAIGARGARKLAAAMMGQDPAEVDDDGTVDELALSAVSEATNQMLASAAAATSAVLGQEIEISPPETRLLDALDTALDGHGAVPYGVQASFTLHGEPCRLVQLVPNAFVVRMTRAFDDLGTMPDDGHPLPQDEAAGAALEESLRGVTVRLTAELGRTRLPARELVGLPAGAVLELDRAADAPIDVCVNGAAIAAGRLVVSDGGWAVRIDTLFHPPTNTPDRKGR